MRLRNRLLKMGVLKPLDDESRKANMYQLSFKFVQDWRFRDKWVRRSRMVARELRFLQLDMEDLYSPASLSSLQKLFAALACSNRKLAALSGDVEDAHLCVEQKRATLIKYTRVAMSCSIIYGTRSWRSKFLSKPGVALRSEFVINRSLPVFACCFHM